MFLVTFGLGGSEADFLRLGFGSAAAAQADTVHGGFRQWRPAVFGHPELISVEDRGRLVIVVRPGGASAVGIADAAFLATSVNAGGRTAFARQTRGVARAVVRGVGATTCARSASGTVAMRTRASGATGAGIRHGASMALSFASRARTAYARSADARLPIAVRSSGVTERVTRSAHTARVRMALVARGDTDISTRAERVAETDERDVALIELLTREL